MPTTSPTRPRATEIANAPPESLTVRAARLRAHPAARYGAAVALAGLATLATAGVRPVIETYTVNVYMVALALAAWYGGLGPGLLATALAALALDYFFAPPYLSLVPLSPSDAVRLALLVVAGTTISWVCHLLRGAVREAADAAERFASSEALFRHTFEHAAVGMAHVALDGRWLRLNARLAEILGYEREVLLAGTFQDVTFAEDLDADLAQVQALIRGEATRYAMDKRYRRRDGTTVWVRLTVALVRDADGRPQYFISAVEDISARKQAESELEATNRQLQEQAMELELQTEALQGAAATLDAERARLARVVAQLPAAVAVYEGPDLVFRGVSAAYQRIVGDRALLGRPIREALPELSGGADGVDFFAQLDRVYATGDPVAFSDAPAEWDADGDGVPEPHRVDVVYAPLRASPEPGQPPERAPVEGVVALVLDVSERARAEAAVRESEARFRNVADSAPVMLWVTTPDGACTFLNRAWLEFTGQTLEQGLGLGWLDAVHPDDAERAGRDFLDASARGAPFRVEYRLRRRDGEYRRAVDAAAPRVGPGGDFLGFVGSVVDVEERARLLDAERAARAQAERAQREAEAERARAEVANRTKGEFLANMSHELRTPLNAIGGYAELLELGVHGPVTEAQRGALARVTRAQQHLLGLINDVLNYAKLEAGRVEYDLQAVDLGAVVAEVAPLVEPMVRARGLAFEVRPSAPCIVWADRDKLAQVLVNLLSNAVKFTESPDPRTGAPGRVTVGVASRDDGDAPRPDLAFVRVTDTGVGIAREQQERIFEPFVQVRAERRSAYAQPVEGTGLGLAISRDLARGMGGDLRVRSAPREGSTFTVSLRRVADDAGRATGRPPRDG